MMNRGRCYRAYRAYLISVLVAAFALLGCSLGSAALPSPVASATLSDLGITFAPVVTATPVGFSPGETPSAAASPTLSTDPCKAPYSRSTASYQVDAVINPRLKTVRAMMRVSYRNQTGKPLDRIVMNIDANRAPGVIKLESLSGTGQTAITRAELSEARLSLDLRSPLETGCYAALTMTFSLNVPPLSLARMRYLSYTERQMNLGYWLPEVAPWLNGDWYTPEKTQFGEYMLSELADFDVQARLEESENRPTMEVIGPGEATRELGSGTTQGNRVWHYKLEGARSFTLAVSDAMARMNTTTSDGQIIDLYYFVRPATSRAAATPGTPVAPPPDPMIAASHALKVAAEAAEQYARRFGPIPYRRLVVVEGDFLDGMELSGLVYVGTQWFTGFRGKFDSWLTLITAHEIAHQWWYVLVGNDQARAPFLDEALALYCELFYIEKVRPDLVPWWWTFRVKALQPKGYVDTASTEYSNARQYIDAVYLRGAMMLQEIRDTIGDTAFWGWLQAYLDRGKNRIATVETFWRSLDPDLYLRINEIRLKYLRNSDPLGIDLPPTTPAPTP